MKINNEFETELEYSWKIIENKEAYLKREKEILSNISLKTPLNLETWMELFLTPLGTFPGALTELLQCNFSKNIKGVALNKNRTFFIWNDIEISFPACYQSFPKIYIDTEFFYKENKPSPKTRFLVNEILPKLKNFGCKDIRQWGIANYPKMNDCNLDNIINYVKEFDEKEKDDI